MSLLKIVRCNETTSHGDINIGELNMSDMVSFEVYYSDLNKDAQRRLCDLFKTSPEEENWDMDIVPLAIIDREMYEEEV